MGVQHFETVCHSGIRGKLDVCLVKDNHQVFGDLGEEIEQRLFRECRTGWVVGVVDEHDLGVGPDGGGNGPEINPVIDERDGGDLSSGAFHDFLIHEKRGEGLDGVSPGREKGPNDELNDFVRSVAEDNLIRREPELAAQCRLQVKPTPVGITVKGAQSLEDGFHGKGGWTKRVLI